MDYLDGWRGLAISGVLVAHFVPVGWIDLGRFGVDLFFVLSGLLMSRILFEQRMPIGLFYRRRVARIIPAFATFLIVIATIFALIGRPASWGELLTFATFTRSYYLHPSIGHSVLPAGHMWSLNVEEHCYILLALIAVVAALRSRATSILFALAALTFLAIRIHMHFRSPSDDFYQLKTECAATAFLCSAGYRTISHRWHVPPWGPILSLLAAAAGYTDWVPWFSRITAAPILLAFAVNHIQESWRWAIRALETGWLRWLGMLSYSVYLWQHPFHIYRADFPFHSALPLAILTGCVSFYALEKPTRRWLNAHWGDARIAPRVAVSEPL